MLCDDVVAPLCSQFQHITKLINQYTRLTNGGYLLGSDRIRSTICTHQPKSDKLSPPLLINLPAMVNIQGYLGCSTALSSHSVTCPSSHPELARSTSKRGLRTVRATKPQSTGTVTRRTRNPGACFYSSAHSWSRWPWTWLLQLHSACTASASEPRMLHHYTATPLARHLQDRICSSQTTAPPALPKKYKGHSPENATNRQSTEHNKSSLGTASPRPLQHTHTVRTAPPAVIQQ